MKVFLICLATIMTTSGIMARADTGDQSPSDLTGDVTDEWRFQVYLNDKPIGYHYFVLRDNGTEQTLEIEAEFKVKVLFVTAYSYRHRNVETWRNGCLAEIKSDTRVNGKAFKVRGGVDPNGFVLNTDETQTGCVKTFAYWNPAFLLGSKLLNSQTGEMMTVDIAPSAQDSKLGKRYKLTGEKLDIDLWYDADHRWVGLESTVKKNRRLRYELIPNNTPPPKVAVLDQVR